MPTPLTRQQLTQLTKEYQDLEDWTTIRDFCTQVFGEGKTAKVEVETNGEYNDEGGTDYSVCSITAYDAQGDELEFDLSLPFWTQPYFADLQNTIKADKEDPQEAALDALKDYYPWRDEDKAIAKTHGYIQWGDLPVDKHNGGDKTYDLTTEPLISFPVVYAASTD